MSLLLHLINGIPFKLHFINIFFNSAKYENCKTYKYAKMNKAKFMSSFSYKSNFNKLLLLVFLKMHKELKRDFVAHLTYDLM